MCNNNPVCLTRFYSNNKCNQHRHTKTCTKIPWLYSSRASHNNNNNRTRSNWFYSSSIKHIRNS